MYIFRLSFIKKVEIAFFHITKNSEDLPVRSAIPSKETHQQMLMRLIFLEYIKLDRDKSTFKSHRDFSSEKEITFKHL